MPHSLPFIDVDVSILKGTEFENYLNHLMLQRIEEARSVTINPAEIGPSEIA